MRRIFELTYHFCSAHYFYTSIYHFNSISNMQDSRWTVSVDKDFAMKKPSRESRATTSVLYRWMHEDSGSSSPQSPRIPIRRKSSNRLSSFMTESSSMTSPPRPPVRSSSSGSLCSNGYLFCQESWLRETILMGGYDPILPWSMDLKGATVKCYMLHCYTMPCTSQKVTN